MDYGSLSLVIATSAFGPLLDFSFIGYCGLFSSDFVLLFMAVNLNLGCYYYISRLHELLWTWA
jgi:hypothetical protein